MINFEQPAPMTISLQESMKSFDSVSSKNEQAPEKNEAYYKIDVSERRSKIDVASPDVSIDTKQIEIESGQKFGVSVIDGRQRIDDGKTPEGPTFVVSMGFAASVDNQFEVNKYAVLADQLKGRLIVVDTPGFGEMATWLKGWSQYYDPMIGKYDSWAKPMLKAAIKAGDLQDGEKIGLIGYSNGGFLASSQAEVLNKNHDELKNLKLEYGVHLIEPTGLNTKNPLKLQATMEQYENDFNPKYYQETADLGWTSPDKERVLSPKDNVSLAVAGIALGGGLKTFVKEYVADKIGIKTPRIDKLNKNGGMVGEALRAALEGSDTTTELNKSTITSTVAEHSHMTNIEQNEKLLHSLTLEERMGDSAIQSTFLLVRRGDTHALPISYKRFASVGRDIGYIVDIDK